MLAKIRNMQPISGEQIYVLSEHVDYWDHDGWKDRFSSPEATQRQVSYVQRLKVAEPYTPQMVVDGIIEFNGSDARAAQAAFEREQHVSKIPVTLTPVEPAGADVRVKVEVQNAPGQLDVILVTANSDATTPVKAGENNGKTLHHVNVMRSIEKLGTVKAGKSFSREVKLKPPSSKEGDAIAVVFAQDPKTGQVWGASSIPLRTGANPTRKP